MGIRTEDVSRVYRRYAGVYDIVFGPLFERGRQLAAELAASAGGRDVLELGVGTGLSLGYYPPGVQVIGIDLSAEMLEKAERRVARLGLGNVALRCMDASRMDLPDRAFDVVVCMYVVSVVPDLDRVMAEVRRVLRPGGSVVIVNHLAFGNPLLAAVERLLARFAGSLGFQPGTALARVERAAGMRRLSLRRIGPFGFWTLLHLRHEPVLG